MMLPWLEPSRRDLWRRLKQQRLGHAPLIHGPRGIGKGLLGDWLARLLLCSRRAAADGQPCGQCADCRLAAAGTHPDHFIVALAEDKQAIGVDQVRDLTERLQLTSSRGGHRVGLLAEAEALNRNAANALLKTLEEPPPGAWLILIAEQPARLPATIRSRCQRFALRQPERALADEWLAASCADASAADRQAALELSAGAPLAARAMLDSGDLAAGLTLLDDLVAGRPHAEVLKRWQDDPAAAWQWLARWMAVIMARTSAAGGWQPPGRRLPQGLDRRRLSRLWQMALAGYREARRGVVRQDLLLGRWLLEWDASQPAQE